MSRAGPASAIPHRWQRHDAPGRAQRRRGAEGGRGITIQGLPLLKPPYGILSAIDLNKGDIAWQIAHGETPDNIRNNPELKGLNIPRTGRPGLLGPLATKTLVICGEAGIFTTPSGARGAMLRAYDKTTGKEVGAVYMPAPQSGSPMTYLLNGEQYLVVAISGGNLSRRVAGFQAATVMRIAIRCADRGCVPPGAERLAGPRKVRAGRCLHEGAGAAGTAAL